MAEFKIRGLVRRLDKAELELRELKVGTGYYDDDHRRHRMRAVRRWIKQDSAKLRALLGSNNQITVATDAKIAELEHDLREKVT